HFGLHCRNPVLILLLHLLHFSFQCRKFVTLAIAILLDRAPGRVGICAGASSNGCPYRDRSSLLVDWSANALRRNAQPPSQSSWSSSTGFAVKRAVIEFWSILFSSHAPWKAEAYYFFGFVSGSLMGEPARLGHAK